MSIVTVNALKCERCKLVWLPHGTEANTLKLPKLCPRCKSCFWNVPKPTKNDILQKLLSRLTL